MEEIPLNPALLDGPFKSPSVNTIKDLSPGESCISEACISRETPTAGSEGPASDTELLRSSVNGDGGAFAELVDRHSAALFRLAQWLLGNRADAEDVLQETFAGAFKGMARFSGRAAVKTWLTQILIRQASKMRYRRGRLRISAPLDPSGGGSGGGEPAVASETTNIDRQMDLTAMIQELPEDHRQVILLREVDGMSYEEIAQTLGIPRGTVESRIHRARAGLRKLLGGYE